MTYLIFNAEGEMIDVLVFDSEEELSSFKALNPTFVVEEEGIEDISSFELDDDSDDCDDIDDSEWL